jgi:hypothetical protein
MRRIWFAILSVLVIASIVGLSAPATQAAVTINFDNAPQGAHFVGNPTVECLATLSSVTCPGERFEIAGVGNANAQAALTVSLTGIVDCNNPGNNRNNPIESHSDSVSATVTSPLLSPKNGRLALERLKATVPTAAQFEAQADCPNPNWTPEVREGSLQLSFTYTVTFVGFEDPVIEITGTLP